MLNDSLEQSTYCILLLRASGLYEEITISHSKEAACYECHVDALISESRALASLFKELSLRIKLSYCGHGIESIY